MGNALLIGGCRASGSVICHACSRRPSARSIFYFGRNKPLRKSYFCWADALSLNQAQLTGSMILKLLMCSVVQSNIHDIHVQLLQSLCSSWSSTPFKPWFHFVDGRTALVQNHRTLPESWSTEAPAGSDQQQQLISSFRAGDVWPIRA